MQACLPSCANDFACQGYNVRSVVDRGGAIVERYAYDPYQPVVEAPFSFARMCAGRRRQAARRVTPGTRDTQDGFWTR